TASEKLGPTGLVTSIKTLPARSPAAAIAAALAAYGVASTTTSAPAAASRTLTSRASPLICAASDCATRSETLLTRKRTACSSCAQRRPSVPPTEPVPMTAIFIGIPLRLIRCAQPIANSGFSQDIVRALRIGLDFLPQLAHVHPQVLRI